MSKRHALTDVDETLLTGTCAVCGPNVRVKKSHTRNEGKKQYYRCYRKYLVTKTAIERPWDFHRKDHCERCGFLPEHDCQLTVDHMDGNRTNNEPSNYRTLCANCHNLKSFQNKDHSNRYSTVQIG